MKSNPIKIDYRKFRPGHPPVVVLGGLSQVWPLGLAHIPVVLVTSEPGNPALHSRYICGYCIWDCNKDKEARGLLAERLLQMGRDLQEITGSRIPLYCGNDNDLSLTFEYHDRFAEHYLMPGNEPALGLILLEKDLFHDFAVRKGLPVPRRYSWDGSNGPAVINAESPVIVKPRHKEMWNQSGGLMELFHSKAKMFPSGRALLAHKGLEAIKDMLFIQDYIPGGDGQIHSFHGLCDNEGELLQWFLGRKIRTFPKTTGESSFLELISDEQLFLAGCNIVNKLGLRGVFKIDFKKDPASGRFYLLEINCRFNLWHYLGAANGVNIPEAAYEYLVHGIRRTPDAYDRRYKWNDFYLDCHAYRELRALGELTFGAWLASLLTPQVQSLFLWKDPAPFLGWVASSLLRKLNKWRSTVS